MIMMWAGSDAARFWKYSWSCSVRGMPSDDGEMPDSNIRARSKGSRVSTPPGPTPSTPPLQAELCAGILSFFVTVHSYRSLFQG